MNVLIINLTRFGDLIQTQPVVTGFKSQGHAVGLICLENFASAATLLDGVDVVFPFPGAGLLSKLDHDWRLAVESVSGFRADVFQRFLPERTVNLTPSVSSRLLTYALSPTSGEVVGFSVDELGFNADTSAWAAFLQLAGANRGASPFNICDIFRRTAGLQDEGNSLVLAQPSEKIVGLASSRLEAATPKGGEGYLGLQMGASEDRRRWPVERFVSVAEAAWKNDRLVPVLLGTKNERHLSEKFFARTNCPAIDLVGDTSLTELAAILTHCRALVTNDTGTMHLAAGLGVPVCAVFLATAQPWDTGPYRAGSICLEPDMDCHPCEFGKPCPYGHACREEVPSEAVYGAILSVLGSETALSAEGARIWRTEIAADGFMNLVSLSGHDAEDRALWIALQRAHYRAFLDGQPFDGSTELAGKMSPSMREELAKSLTSGHDMLFLLLQQGALLARNPRPQAKNKFLASWQRLQSVLGESKYLDILGKLWMFESQRAGGDLGSLLSLTERFHALFSSIRNEVV